MSGNTSTHFNTKELHREFGPAPWWDEERLRELVQGRGLDARDIAAVWNVHAKTVDDWITEYGIREASA